MLKKESLEEMTSGIRPFKMHKVYGTPPASPQFNCNSAANYNLFV
jgi:hypothetical protein